ncbi:hypothetical protein COOONC_15087 [Cooperia oncophora]
MTRHFQAPNAERGLLVCLFFILAECRIELDSSSEEYPEKEYTNRRSTLEAFRNRKIPTEAEELTGQELVDYVNSHQSLWKRLVRVNHWVFRQGLNRRRSPIIGPEQNGAHWE